jgi:anti-sigma regulatory factor (Ser/Thr protein kinase)
MSLRSHRPLRTLGGLLLPHRPEESTIMTSNSRVPDRGAAARAILLPPTAQGPLAARNFARDMLDEWRIPAAYEVALIASELVTNAVIHTSGTITLSLGLRDDAVRIVCTDDNAGAIPIRRGRVRATENGRGLILVGALSFEWGVEEHAGGKTVWADVALRRPETVLRLVDDRPGLVEKTRPTRDAPPQSQRRTRRVTAGGLVGL